MKIFKLLLIAIALLSAIYGIMQIVPNTDTDTDEPELSSDQANMWKQKIIDLCKDAVWTTDGYEKIEKGIHSDRVISEGETITIDEENALKKYLFASSCRWLSETSDIFFKQEAYEDSKIDAYDNALNLLTEKNESFPNNSNYEKAKRLISSYHLLVSLLSFGSNAKYSHPLKAYNGGKSGERRQRIEKLSCYNTHFCNNTKISSQVATLEENMKKAESDYYINLEKCIEKNYENSKDFEVLLDDQIDFKRISTNEDAIDRLSKFVRRIN